MNGSTVLIVDDERNLARAMKALLAEHGYESEVAGDAEQALQLLPTMHPDVVFSDVRLPGMNGIELLKRIKEFDPAIPVVIMTAFGSIEGAVAAVKLGAFDYVKKPLDLEELKLLADRARETSLMKWFACDAALEAANDAIQVHGSYGYSNEYPVERFWRNSRGAVIYEGTREIHTLLQADYALGYRQDKPLRCPQPPAEGFEREEERVPALAL